MRSVAEGLGLDVVDDAGGGWTAKLTHRIDYPRGHGIRTTTYDCTRRVRNGVEIEVVSYERRDEVCDADDRRCGDVLQGSLP